MISTIRKVVDTPTNTWLLVADKVNRHYYIHTHVWQDDSTGGHFVEVGEPQVFQGYKLYEAQATALNNAECCFLENPRLAVSYQDAVHLIAPRHVPINKLQR